MKKRIQQTLKNEKGLTLVELLAVIVILGIIAAIAVPSIGKIIENTKYNAVKADAISALNAANLYFADEPDATATETVSVKELVDGGYLENSGKLIDEVEIMNDSPKTIDGGPNEYSNGKTVTFDKAELDDINKDITKGSSVSGGITIP